jgi:hypothetical protein
MLTIRRSFAVFGVACHLVLIASCAHRQPQERICTFPKLGIQVTESELKSILADITVIPFLREASNNDSVGVFVLARVGDSYRLSVVDVVRNYTGYPMERGTPVNLDIQTIGGPLVYGAPSLVLVLARHDGHWVFEERDYAIWMYMNEDKLYHVLIPNWKNKAMLEPWNPGLTLSEIKKIANE